MSVDQLRPNSERPTGLVEPTASRAAQVWCENRPTAGWRRGFDLRELAAHRYLAYLFVVRDLKVRYKQTVLGIAWALIQPLAAMAVLSVFLGRLAKVPSENLPYPLFVFAGLAAWGYMSSGVLAAAASLVENRALVTKVFFPRLIAPVAAVVPGLVDLAVATAAIGVTMAIYARAPSAAIVLLPLWILAAVVATAAIGIWFAAANALYRDVRYVLGVGIQLWLFLSPVVYPSNLVHGALRYVWALNPAVGIIDAFRWIVVNGPAPPAADLVSLFSTLVLLLGGLLYFGRVDRLMADRI